ncbi:MAG: hypothetical protein ABIK62_02750, partial [candidate division WOR-3 bacterium]
MRMQVMRANWSTLVVAASLVFGGLLASQPLTDGAFLSWDVGPTRILAPSGNVDSGAVFTPQVRVRNFGDSTVSFPVYLRIGPNYADTQGVTDLAGGDSIVVSFDPWTALVRWTNGIICSTALSMDENPTNDRESASVYVRIRDVGVSRLVAPLGIV